MKPVVLVVKEKDGKLDITKEELQKMIDEVYEQGYKDGDKKVPIITPIEPDITAPQVYYDSVGNPYQYCDKAISKEEVYEKIPYWQRPGYIVPTPTCSTNLSDMVKPKVPPKKKPANKPKVENKKPYLDTGCSYLSE